MVSRKLRDQLTTQALEELNLAREAKEKAIKEWKTNHKLYDLSYDMHIKEGRAKARPPYAFGFVETLLSKIKNYPEIKFGKGSNADQEQAELVTALYHKQAQPNAENFEGTDLDAKRSAIFTGRAVIEVFGKSKPFRFVQNLISSFDFYIDPIAGSNIENALYVGNKGVLLTEHELIQGKKEKRYTADVKVVLESKEDALTQKDDEIVIVEGRERLAKTGRFEFLKWGTTDRKTGKRYYLLIHLNSQTCIRCVPLTEMYKAEEGEDQPYWWYESWAAYPDRKNFWSMAPLSIVRNLLQLRIKNLNNIADAVEEEVRPVTYYDPSLIDSPLLLDYTPGGHVPVMGSPKDGIWHKPAPDIKKAQEFDEMLSRDIQLETGITNDARGISDEDKVGIYEGNLANIQDRLSLLNDSYSFFYERVCMRFVAICKEFLTTKETVRIVGKDGIKWRTVSKSDLKSRHNYDINIEASENAAQREAAKKRDQLQFVQGNKGNPIVNQSWLIEKEAEIVGFGYEEIKEALDVSTHNDSKMMSEADRDIELLVNGEDIDLNEAATAAYMQRIIDYARQEAENLDSETEELLLEFAQAHMDIVARNEMKAAKEQMAEEGSLLPPEMAGEMMNPEEIAEAPTDAMPLDQPTEQRLPTNLI